MKLIFNLPEGKVEEFTVAKPIVTVGRGNVCDVVLPFEGFSRKHAQIELVEGEIFVTDLGSTNGVYIDGSRIQPGVRTQMQTFLSLQIGPAQQVEIIDDVPAAAPQRHADMPSRDRTRTMVRKPDTSEHTKTTQMDPKLLRKMPRKEKESSSKDSQSKMAMVLLPVLILAGAGYYFFMNGETPEEAPEAIETSQAPVVPLTEVDFLSAAQLESLAQNKSCSGDKAVWCKEAGVLESNSEGVVIEGKTLVVYMNMSLYRNDKFHESFNQMDESQRLEILTLRRIFTSTIIRTLSRQTTLDTLQVASGMVEQEGFKLRLALKIKRDIDLKKADKFFMYDAFDRIINEGATQDISEISNFYDKLPLN